MTDGLSLCTCVIRSRLTKLATTGAGKLIGFSGGCEITRIYEGDDIGVLDVYAVQGWAGGHTLAVADTASRTPVAAAYRPVLANMQRQSRKQIADAPAPAPAKRRGAKEGNEDAAIAAAAAAVAATDAAGAGAATALELDVADDVLAAMEDQDTFEQHSWSNKETKRRPLRANSKFDLGGKGSGEQNDGLERKDDVADTQELADLSFKLRRLDSSEESEGRQNDFGIVEVANEISGDIEMLARYVGVGQRRWKR